MRPNRSPCPDSEHATANTSQWPLPSVRRVFSVRLFNELETFEPFSVQSFVGNSDTEPRLTVDRSYFFVIAFFNNIFHSVIFILS